MRKILICVFLFCLLQLSCLREKLAPESEQSFNKYYGLNLSNEGIDAKQLGDGGFIVLGSTTNGSGIKSMCLVKTDIFGNPEWAKQIDGVKNEIGIGIQVLPDGNFIVVANLFSGDSVKISLRKISNSGNVLWAKQYAILSRQFANNVQLTSSGGIVIAGRVEKNLATAALLIFTSIDGDKSDSVVNPQSIFKSTATSKNPSNYEAKYITEIKSGKFIVVGSSNYKLGSHGLSDVIISTVNTTGNIHKLATTKFFGGTKSDSGYCIKAITDSTFICLASKSTIDSGANIYLFKFKLNTNDGFDMIWEKNYDTPNDDKATSMEMISKDEFAITGTTMQKNGNSSTMFLKVDGNGNEITSKTYGFSGKRSGKKLVKTIDNGFVIVGSNENSTFSMINLMKIMNNGDF